MATAKGGLNVCTGTETVQTICKLQSGYSVSKFIQNNSFNFKKHNPNECDAYEEYKAKVKKGDSPRISSYPPLTQLFIKGVKVPNSNKTKKIKPTTQVKDYLNFCNNNNLKVVQGLVVEIPFTANGGLTASNSYYIDNRGIPKLLTNDYVIEKKRASGDILGGTAYTTCDSYFQRITPTGDREIAPLPVIPQEFGDTNSVNWNTVSLMGRSVDYQIYTGSSREVSFTLMLHQEVFSDVAVKLGTNLLNIYNLVKLIESSCYPYYTEAWAGPPQVVFKIGTHMYIRGVLTSCNVNWKLPIDLDKNSSTYGKYTNCEISVSVRETNGPYGAYDIANVNTSSGMGAYRNQTVTSEGITTINQEYKEDLAYLARMGRATHGGN